MAGIVNDVLYALNCDYTGGNSLLAAESNGLVTNGKMWIGSTALNAGGTHINVGTLTSPDGSITIGYSSPNITLQAGTPTVNSIGVQAYVSSNLTLQTGDGTNSTFVFNTNTWQVGGSNMNNGTGVYTIPAGGAGKYLISYGISFTSLTASHTVGDYSIFVGASAVNRSVFNPGVSRNANDEFQFCSSAIVNLADADTVFIRGFVSGSTKTVGYKGTLVGSPTSYVSISRLFV